MCRVNTRFWQSRAGCWSRKVVEPVSLLGDGGFLKAEVGRNTLLDDEDDEDDIDFSKELSFLEKMGR